MFVRPRYTALLIATLLAAAAVCAQTWDYRSYKKGKSSMGNQYDKGNYVDGTITLEEKDGKGVMRLTAGSVDICLRGELAVAVEKTGETTIITVPPPVTGCEEIRYVIKNDGSGGTRQVKRGDAWVNDRFEHLLTLKK
jgi:hypothetical protein